MKFLEKLESYSSLKLEFEKLKEFLTTNEIKIAQTDKSFADNENKLDNRLYEELKGVKNILQIKFDELHHQEMERMKMEARLASEFENTKQKYLLEISRLNSLLKMKDEEGEKFKQQYEMLSEKIQLCQDDKRRKLIEKSLDLSFIHSESDRNGHSDFLVVESSVPPHPSPSLNN